MNNSKFIFKIYGAYPWKEEDIEHKQKKNLYTLIVLNSLINRVKISCKGLSG